MIDPARSFDRAAAAYEAARPGYPEAVLDLLPLGAEAEVLDLGAGTGKLTRMLVRRYRRVVAVEPLPGMRAILEAVVPEADSYAGSAEAIPLPDGSVDGVLAAQAFHWFATDEAVAEIARVLRPGGTFAVVWNETLEPYPLPAAYVERTRELCPPPDDAALEQRLAAISRGPFGEIARASAEHEQMQSRDAVLSFLSSVSAVAHRPDAERERLLAELGDLVPEGEYRFRMRANVYWARRA